MYIINRKREYYQLLLAGTGSDILIIKNRRCIPGAETGPDQRPPVPFGSQVGV